MSKKEDRIIEVLLNIDFKEARHLITAMADSESKEMFLKRTATAFLLAGEFRPANVIVVLMKHKENQDTLLARLARAYFKENDLEAAEKAVVIMSKGKKQDILLERLSLAYLREELPVKAVDLAEEMMDVKRRYKVLTSIIFYSFEKWTYSAQKAVRLIPTECRAEIKKKVERRIKKEFTTQPQYFRNRALEQIKELFTN